MDLFVCLLKDTENTLLKEWYKIVFFTIIIIFITHVSSYVLIILIKLLFCQNE